MSTERKARAKILRRAPGSGKRAGAEEPGVEVRVVYRIRDLVTGGWKMHNVFGGVDSGPMEWGNAESARDAAKYLKRWRLVKVTIRSTQHKGKSKEDT